LTTGSYNTAFGAHADGTGDWFTTGQMSTHLGALAGAYLNGSYNTFVGSSTGMGAGASAPQTGGSNVGIGYRSMGSNSLTSGGGNTCVGVYSGYSIVGGTGNVFIGSSAGENNTGVKNTVVGGYALDASNANGGNTAVGYWALTACTNADSTAIGYEAGKANTSGSQNIFIGTSAGLTGHPGGNITTASNEICLGNSTITTANIQVDWSIASDERDKADKTNFTGGLDWVNAMQPITYYWDQRVLYCEPTDPTLEITTSIANTFTVGETITGQSSNSTATFKSGSGDTITFDMDSVGGEFEASETIIGEESEIEATVAASDFYNDGQVTPADVLAVTPDGTHKEDAINVGFLAQDILDIEQANGYALAGNDSSIIVDESEDGTRYSMKTVKIIPILVNAIKELSTKNDALEARIEALENA
jgi:hypothetical protein